METVERELVKGVSDICVEAFITKEIKDGAHGKHNIE